MKRLRGDSLIEVMIAGAVLLVGLSAVVLALVYAANNTSEAGKMMEASQIGMGLADSVSARGFENITTGVQTTYSGPNNRFTEVVTITAGGPLPDGGTLISLPDGGFADGGVNTFRVAVDVSYRNASLQTRSQRYETIVSPKFDPNN